MKSLGIIVNPMSGRDVRRVAARASTSTHHEKQQQVTRLVLGALEMGVEKIYLGNEPFRINERAVENLEEKDSVEILEYPLTHTARDTALMAQRMWDKGCRVFIVLGGDGTSRIVAKTLKDAVILPLSTGTNNVFPEFVEASIAGAAAGLIASRRLKFENHCYRCKQIHISVNGEPKDLALIDAVLLTNDSLGSLLPFAPQNLSRIFLTRAEPASVGISPIGGYLYPIGAEDPHGLMIHCGTEKSITQVRVPISPGLYGDVSIQSHQEMVLGQAYRLDACGILAFDGDRTIEVSPDDLVDVTVRQDGPWIIEAHRIFETAAAHGLLAGSA